MRITWIGHACFFIEAPEGRIVIDPFAEEIPYAFPKLEADLVTVSHAHFDHNAADRVGGNYTIDAKQAASVIAGLPQVKLVIPMHFNTAAIADWPIATVEEFESLMDNVRRVGASTTEVTRESLPGQREVRILDHA